MGCVESKLPGGAAEALTSQKKSLFDKVKGRKGTKLSSGSTVSDLDVKVDYEADRVVDNLKAEAQIHRALLAKRRGDVFDESFEPSKVDDASFLQPVVKKTSKVQSLLDKAIHGNILFRDLSNEQIKHIINSLEKKEVKAGTKVITQGERGDMFYIVESGSFDFIVDGDPIGSCAKGESFGELALLYNAPRAATVESKEDSVVWMLERKHFRHVVAGTIQRKQNEIRKALRKVSLLNSLDVGQINLISDAVEAVSFRAGETIIRKGDSGNLFFMIRSGQVKCTRMGVGSRGSSVDVTLGEGNYFGERALLKSEPRAANVIAITDVECLVLEREAFHSLLGPLREILDFNLGMRVIGSIPLFEHLSQNERKKIMKALKEEKFSAGEEIIRQNDKGGKFYLIKEGDVHVTKTVNGVSEPASIAELSTGDYFGEGSLLKDEPRGASVIAGSSTVVCLTMERSTFEKILGPLEKILRRELDTRDDEMTAIVKNQTKKVEDTLKLSDLKMLKTLGTGTFGRVKLVECTSLGKTYALKCLQKSQIVAYRQQKNVISEKEILMECDHPFILKLFRTFKDKHSLYLLLELVLGGELFTLLHIRGGTLGNNDSRFYAACVVDALEYLHSKTIVYRDLKPENLMIDEAGYIKVVDFGFAKKVKDKTYTLCGTPEYLAPELILAKGHNKAVDNWAVGVLIYEMVCGVSPFADHENNDHMVICKNIVRGKVEWPRKFPEKAKDLVIRLLNRDAHLRLGSQKDGTGEIKQHPWFKAVDFNELQRKRLKAPWVPPIKNHLDTSNFDDYPEDDYVEPYRSNGSNWDKDF